MRNKPVSSGLIKLQKENEELARRLAEAEETLQAIREGEVDAIVVSGTGGERVFSLTGAEQVYRLIVETMKEAALTVSSEGTILYCNAQLAELLGIPHENIVGRPLQQFVSPEHRPSITELLARAVNEPVKQRLVFQTEGRTGVSAHISANVLHQPDALSVCIVVTDLTELEASMNDLREAEAGLRKINQLLQMISDCNQAIIRIEDEQALMNELCRIVVEEGCYRMAWVGFAENDEDKSVRPVAYTGFEEGYLESARISWADTDRGRGPTGTAIRTGTIQFGRNFLTDPSLAPWRDTAIQRGFRSSIALPLRDDRGVFGALTIYAATEEAVDDPELKILVELADDLAFGLTMIRTRSALRDSRDRLRALAGELTLTERRERQRMAQILHDHIQQLLVGAKFRVHALGTVRDDSLPGRTREVENLLDECIAVSRTLTAELSPPILQQGGLTASLEWLAQWMCDKHGLKVELALEKENFSVPQDVKLLVFESTRELLFNVVKHSQVKSARLSLQPVNHHYLQIVVSDSGVGFDPDSLSSCQSKVGSFGLFSIRERMNLIGGQLQISSKPGEGSHFALLVPLAAPSAPQSQNIKARDRVSPRLP